jgi:hypothetical protein
MDAADAARGEDRDTGERRADHRGGDRGAAGAAHGDREAEIGAAELERVRGIG